MGLSFSSSHSRLHSSVYTLSAAELKDATESIALQERPRNSLGRFVSKESRTSEEQRRENAQKIISSVQDLLLNATEKDLEPRPEDNLNILLMKTLVRNVRNSDPDKTISGSVKLLETLHKSAGVYDKQERNNGAEFSVVIVDPLAGMSAEERAEALRTATEYKPPVRKKRPSWVQAEPAIDTANAFDGEYVDGEYKPRNPRGSA